MWWQETVTLPVKLTVIEASQIHKSYNTDQELRVPVPKTYTGALTLEGFTCTHLQDPSQLTLSKRSYLLPTSNKSRTIAFSKCPESVHHTEINRLNG